MSVVAITPASAGHPSVALATPLPATEDPLDLRLREELTSGDPATRSSAALALAQMYARRAPRAARLFLLQASRGPPLTAARALLRLAYVEHREAREADVSEGERTRMLTNVRLRLAHASELSEQALAERGTADLDVIALRIDIGAAFSLSDQPQEGIRLLQHVAAQIEGERRSQRVGDPVEERLRGYAALASLRLGQAQAETDHTSAVAALRHASIIGAGSVAATAALELGWRLEAVAGANGPDIEEQYRRAAELADPVASPKALVSLGDVLWRRGRPDKARQAWVEAFATQDRAVMARVVRRLKGEWPSTPAQPGDPPPPAPLAGAEPRRAVEPPTALGRVALGRAADDPGRRRRIVVIGSGTGGHYLLPGLARDYTVCGFVDDSSAVADVNGIPVLGTIDELETVIAGTRAEQVILAIPTASGELRHRVLQMTHRCGKTLQTLPTMFELRRGHPLVPQLRAVEVYETFGDFPWDVDRAAANLVRDRRVAIVGAGTPIGVELARRVAHGQARHLLLLDGVQGPVLEIAKELNEHRDFVDCDTRIVDATDATALGEALGEFAPEIVFNCGGINYAPEPELPRAYAARANVLAADTVARVSKAHGAGDCVMVSADRAAHRSCSFDLTKAIAEHAALQHAAAARDRRPGTLRPLALADASGFRVSVLRLPNVWTRDGQIVGRLKRQLHDGGPVRVDPTARRRFVPTWEAAQALLRLLSEDHAGGIFAYTRGDVVALREVADRLIWMNGLKVGVDVTVADASEPDGKAGLHLVGEQESATETPIASTVAIAQSQRLTRELTARSAQLRRFFRDGRRRDCEHALALDGYGRPPRARAG